MYYEAGQDGQVQARGGVSLGLANSILRRHCLWPIITPLKFRLAKKYLSCVQIWARLQKQDLIPFTDPIYYMVCNVTS